MVLCKQGGRALRGCVCCVPYSSDVRGYCCGSSQSKRGPVCAANVALHNVCIKQHQGSFSHGLAEGLSRCSWRRPECAGFVQSLHTAGLSEPDLRDVVDLTVVLGIDQSCFTLHTILHTMLHAGSFADILHGLINSCVAH